MVADKVAGRRIEKLLDRNMDITDVSLSKGALADEVEVESEKVVLQSLFVEGELDREVPGGVGVVDWVHWRFEFLVGGGVAGDGDDGEDVHFGD